jgi:prolyl-tRNA synthetase
MLRAGMMRKVAAGVYSYLPLGWRVIRKVEQIVREEMDRAGAVETLLPTLQPKELWEEAGHWHDFGKEKMRISDRHDREFALGPTHEWVVTDIARHDIRSYRQMPINLYQIQTKFRDEIRPRFGLIRAREFIMKDAYSFDRDEQGIDLSYKKMFDAYCRIFDRCGLRYVAVEADAGPIGGSYTEEFMVLAESGDEPVVICPGCGFAARPERAEATFRGKSGNDDPQAIEKIATPDMRTIEQLTNFLERRPEEFLKSLVYVADGEPVVAIVRGDHELSESKLGKLLGSTDLEMADEETIERVSGGPLGFTGPVGLSGVRIIADNAVPHMANAVTGANEGDFHLLNVNYDRDFRAETVEDIRVATEGDVCPQCERAIEFHRGIEVGHTFKLGKAYSEPLKAVFLDEKGEENCFIMGCYGIGITRTVAAAIEQHHDDAGIIWPVPLAPYQVLILPIAMANDKIVEVSDKLYEQLTELGIEVLYDDRDERPGVKFKDGDLIGIPFRVCVGDRNLKNEQVEVYDRRTGETELVPVENVVQHIQQQL